MTINTISVVVPTFSQSKKLKRLLDSFDGLRDYLPVEVIVVDDSSDDDTPNILEEWSNSAHKFDAIRLRLKTNRGPAGARNEGVHRARGDIVAFTDTDCIVDKLWLKELVKPLKKEERIIGIGGKVKSLKKDLISLYSTFHRVLEPPDSLLYLVTANCCYYRDELLQVGVFDEEIRKPGGEDIALSIKLAQGHWHFGYAPSAIVYHEFRNSIWDFLRTYKNYGAGCAYVSEKYLEGLK